MGTGWGNATPNRRRAEEEKRYLELCDALMMVAFQPGAHIKTIISSIEIEEIIVLVGRNRRATNHRSHLSLIPPKKLFPGRNDILVYKHPSDSIDTLPQIQRRPGPDDPRWKIPVSEWSTVLRRVEQNHEPLRQVAKDYNVSYEAVRRVLRAARKQRKTG